MAEEASPPSPHRLIEITLDEASIGRSLPEVDHERQVAIFDLLEENVFKLPEGPPGPYKLMIALAEQRLVLAVSPADASQPAVTFLLSLTPFRKLLKDYFLVCESYFEAIKSAPPSRIEALDMGRRALHDEGSRLLVERLEGKVWTDDATARRLFTLLCALHWKG